MLDQDADDLNGPISDNLNVIQLYIIDGCLRVEFDEHRGSRVHEEPQLHDIPVVADD